jgi:hypothetical protein
MPCAELAQVEHEEDLAEESPMMKKMMDKPDLA